jgi:hypothetical protein
MMFDLSDGEILQGEEKQSIFWKTLIQCFEKIGKISGLD